MSRFTPLDEEDGDDGALRDALYSDPLDEGSAPWKRVPRWMLLAMGVGMVIAVFVVVVAIIMHATAPPPPPHGRVTILISLDGFRWDYLVNKSKLFPAISALAVNGTSAASLISSFPTKTFPNHYTLVTGLYPESHGIVGNRFYDPKSGKLFTMSDSTDPMWWGGEPIWVTAAKRGLRTACYFWPGSDVEIKGHRPTYFHPYSASVGNTDRVNGVLAWLRLPPRLRPHFVTLYMSTVDTAGHLYGPESEEVTHAVFQVDNAIGHLVHGLKSAGMLDTTDIIVTSDHGMTALCSKRVIQLGAIAPEIAARATHDLKIIDYSPVLAIWPKNLSESASIVEQLQGNEHLAVYLREDVPERLHYSHNARIAPVIGIVDLGWSLVSGTSTEFGSGGAHGYDNAFSDMASIFIASGPSFRNDGFVANSFENVQLYHLLCTLLNIPLQHRAPNNGTVGALDILLRPAVSK